MITFKLLHKNAKVCLPPYKGDVGFDLALPEDIFLWPNNTKQISLGVSINTEYFAFLLPRSSVSKKALLVYTGTIDPGYEGELKCTITNLNRESLALKQGEKIAQLVFLTPAAVGGTIQIINSNGESDYLIPENFKPRLTSGFGSSGE